MDITVAFGEILVRNDKSVLHSRQSSESKIENITTILQPVERIQTQGLSSDGSEKEKTKGENEEVRGRADERIFQKVEGIGRNVEPSMNPRPKDETILKISSNSTNGDIKSNLAHKKLEGSKMDKETATQEVKESRQDEENVVAPQDEDFVEAADFGLKAMNNLYYIKEPKLYSMGQYDASELHEFFQ